MSGAPEAEVLAEIEAIARRCLGFQGHLHRDSSLVEALELDSVRKLTLVVEVENTFRIALDTDAEAEIGTVGDLVDLLVSHGRS